MFYYYGRKKQFVRQYPAPLFSRIVEPFAGSAAYSLHGENWKKQVLLIEKDEQVSDIWKWLICKATPEMIRSLPEPEVGEKSSSFLYILHAATKMAFLYKTIKTTPVLKRNWDCSKRYMAENLYKVKHWKVICSDYSEAPDEVATWFIDPPYRNSSGVGYRHGNKKIDYNALAEWIKQRRGQVIACEGSGADYLPFQQLFVQKGVAGKSNEELVYLQLNETAEYDSSVADLPLFATAVSGG